MYGYLLKVGNIMKGRSIKVWYEIQMQTDDGLEKFWDIIQISIRIQVTSIILVKRFQLT